MKQPFGEAVFSVNFALLFLSPYQYNINTIPAALYAHGLRYAVISPGSRNAPLIMAFARFKKITCISVPDERTAGFVALGISKQLQQPAAVICTSGTAVLNLYPAVAEAYYMQVPLIVLTADRPAEMIDRWDGQTIRQYEVFKPHIRCSLQTPEQLTTDCVNEITTLINKLYSEATLNVCGPVHMNVPLAEPLYAAAPEVFDYPSITVSDSMTDPSTILELPSFDFSANKKIMILLGADNPPESSEALETIARQGHAMVIGDIISNRLSAINIPSWEGLLLLNTDELRQDFVPDLLITTGKMVLNKALRNLLRKQPPAQHWHVSATGFSADTFFTTPLVIKATENSFFDALVAQLPQESSSYFNAWSQKAQQFEHQTETITCAGYNEFNAVAQVLNTLPQNTVLHLANSMSIRYVAYLAGKTKPEWEIYSNRGVSGIDGCSSTAVGAALADNRPHFLITGDIAFFYDINAFWQRELPKNLKIVLLNNGGGGIFSHIDGPAGLPELDPYLGTPHSKNAALMADHFGLQYFSSTDAKELEEALKKFSRNERPAILEIITEPAVNAAIFKQFKQQFL